MSRTLRWTCPVIVGLLMLPGLFSAWWNPAVDYRPSSREKTADKGELVRVAGYPVLRLRGSPYERGYQHGFLFREEVRANVRSFLGYVYHEFPLGKYAAQALLDYAYHCFGPFIPQ